MNNVCFTGHREINKASIREALYEAIEQLIEDGADTFYAGGASGFDTFAAQAVLDLRVLYPWVSLVLILPCPPEEQSQSFSQGQKITYDEILRSADRVECVSDHYNEKCMKLRNQRLIDYADICVCCYDKRRHATGTGQTVRMAEKKGITVINLFKG